MNPTQYLPPTSGWVILGQLLHNRPWLTVALCAIVIALIVIAVLIRGFIDDLQLVRRTKNRMDLIAQAYLAAHERVIKVLNGIIRRRDEQIQDMAGSINSAAQQLSKNWAVPKLDDELEELDLDTTLRAIK